MKKLITVITVLLLIVGCKKQTSDQLVLPEEVLQTRKEYANSNRIPDPVNQNTSRRDNNLFYHTCANGWADQTQSTEGVAASVNVEKLSLQGAKIKSWWIGAFYYDTLADGRIGKFWVQWGYAVDRGGLFQAFYVYKISPVYGQMWPLTIINQNNTVPLAYGTRVRFEIKHVFGTTFWSFLRDGQKVFDVDLGVTAFDGTLQSCTESWGSTSFSTLVHVDYFDIYRNGTWSHMPGGQIGSADAWNVVGSVQRPEFDKSEHEHGGRLPNPITNYLLW